MTRAVSVANPMSATMAHPARYLRERDDGVEREGAVEAPASIFTWPARDAIRV
jgi:hypothetical protein